MEDINKKYLEDLSRALESGETPTGDFVDRIKKVHELADKYESTTKLKSLEEKMDANKEKSLEEKILANKEKSLEEKLSNRNRSHIELHEKILQAANSALNIYSSLEQHNIILENNVDNKNYYDVLEQFNQQLKALSRECIDLHCLLGNEIAFDIYKIYYENGK